MTKPIHYFDVNDEKSHSLEFRECGKPITMQGAFSSKKKGFDEEAYNSSPLNQKVHVKIIKKPIKKISTTIL